MLPIRLMAAGALTAILALYGLSGITKINPGEVGILVKNIGEGRGMQEKTLDVGMRWVEPFSFDVITYNVKFQQYEMFDTRAETKDGQPIELDISFEIGLDRNVVPDLHNTVGKDWYDQVVYPAARDAIRQASSSEFSADVYTSEGRTRIVGYADQVLQEKFTHRGINITTNLRDLSFLNEQFVQTLEQKSIAAEQEDIQQRLAAAAEQEAIKIANIAEGQKQKRIKEAEANKEELRLEGEGERLKQEETALGILAIAKAKAEGTRLQVLAYGDGKTYASVKWAENLGPNVKVYGVPTGAPGTNTLVDINGVLKNAFTGVK